MEECGDAELVAGIICNVKVTAAGLARMKQIRGRLSVAPLNPNPSYSLSLDHIVVV